MELVYLWVEEYKNIHRQGFNFSPKFNCHYDEDKNELTIDENDDYIENFFGDNINVTAIVGKNGSGKSSVLEVLTYLYWQGQIRSEEDKTYFLYKKGDNFSLQCNNYEIHSRKPFKDFININNNTKIKSPAHFSDRTQMSLISFSNCISDITHNKQLKNLKTYDKFYNGIQPDTPMMKSKDVYDNFNQKFLNILKYKKDFFDFVDKNLIFTDFQVELHINELGAWFIGDKLYEKLIISEDSNELLSFGRTEEDTKSALYRALSLFLIEKSRSIRRYDDLDQRSNEEDEEYLKKNIFNKVKELFKQKDFGEEEYKKVLDVCLEALKPSFNNLKKRVRDSFLPEDYSVEVVDRIIKKYNFDKPNIYKSKTYSIDDVTIENVIESALEKDLLNEKVLRVNFFKNNDKSHSFLNLSSGEKLYLNILTNYAYTLFKLEDNYKGIVLFDEIELSFHPDWQKRILKHLMYIFHNIQESRKVNLHLLFTTHSPFLLSDISKQNIIFLDKNEKGNCKVVNGLKEKKQTFGANIQTLLSDSFFMEDGLMGEFAKGKINEIIEFHNEIEEEEKKEKSNFDLVKARYKEKKKRFWQTQSIIGEDYLKQVIKNHLRDIENILWGHDEAKQEEIKRLRAEADKLERLP
ncbi:AAA family ATPase [Sulfurovum sp. NBC37-1]|uniref:AAA family ATPase n=1 Tax=Sulfurovum sp. (strain NBC37-1) TaxID=387093 RepID=UPI0001587D8E|nr:AAA family ATPase [Sulfurovum sp. NBC37-1]BAF73204.1 hypothetical protein SUN_2264 [Sulfurovum sp. NBC37-1]